MERKKRADAALRFLLDHEEKWREEYPNRWVAVHGAKLIAVEDTWERLVKRVTEAGYDMTQVQRQFITEQRPLFLL